METKKTPFSVTFWVRENKSKGLEVPIYARVTIDGKRMEQSTNQKILPADWSGKKGMANSLKTDTSAHRGETYICFASVLTCSEVFLYKNMVRNAFARRIRFFVSLLLRIAIPKVGSGSV